LGEVLLSTNFSIISSARFPFLFPRLIWKRKSGFTQFLSASPSPKCVGGFLGENPTIHLRFPPFSLNFQRNYHSMNFPVIVFQKEMEIKPSAPVSIRSPLLFTYLGGDCSPYGEIASFVINQKMEKVGETFHGSFASKSDSLHFLRFLILIQANASNC
jgi:hypothetical protein